VAGDAAEPAPVELRAAIRGTGSVRSFLDRPVDDEVVHAILDDARFAPSGGNRQPWRVAVVADAQLRRHLATLMQPVWDRYVAVGATGATPYAWGGHVPDDAPHAPNALLDGIERVPVVLAVACDLDRIAMMDAGAGLERPPVTAGASVYPFCWNVLLAARARGIGGVMTTFLSRVEQEAAAPLGLPPRHALAATIFLGHAERIPSRLSRRPVDAFASRDRFDGPALGGGSS